MKRLVLTIATLGLAFAAHAQMMLQRPVVLPDVQPLPDSTVTDTTHCGGDPHAVNLFLGVGAGATLYNSNLDYSPYYSRFGLQLQVPLWFNYRLSPHWALSAGMRYDLRFDPLVYAVKINPYDNGLDFESAALPGKQSAYVLRHYVGVPLKATWYPWPGESRLLGITFDLFAGYCFDGHILTRTTEVYRTVIGSEQNIDVEGYSDRSSNDPSLLPWKLELGASLTTDVLGMMHSVRFFVDLLPSYRDPLTGETLHTAGMTIFF